MEVQLQFVDEVRGNVSLGQSGDIAKLLRSVIRHESVHKNILFRNTQAVGNTSWKVCKYLHSGFGLANDERIVKPEAKADLYKRKIRRRIRHASGWLHETWHGSWKAAGRVRRCGSTSNDFSTTSLCVARAWREAPCCGQRQCGLSVSPGCNDRYLWLD